MLHVESPAPAAFSIESPLFGTGLGIIGMWSAHMKGGWRGDDISDSLEQRIRAARLQIDGWKLTSYPSPLIAGDPLDNKVAPKRETFIGMLPRFCRLCLGDF